MGWDTFFSWQFASHISQELSMNNPQLGTTLGKHEAGVQKAWLPVCHMAMGQNPVPLMNIPKIIIIVFIGMFTYPILMVIDINPWPFAENNSIVIQPLRRKKLWGRRLSLKPPGRRDPSAGRGSRSPSNRWNKLLIVGEDMWIFHWLEICWRLEICWYVKQTIDSWRYVVVFFNHGYRELIHLWKKCDFPWWE